MLYFSGTGTPAETSVLVGAGVRSVRCDQADLKRTTDFAHAVLSSGAYRLHKAGKSLDVAKYAEVAKSRMFDLVLSPESAVDSASENLRLYDAFKAVVPDCVPVWNLGDSPAILERHLAETTGPVAIGKLAPAFRIRDKDALAKVERLADMHGARLHLLGCNSVAAINRVVGKVRSLDCSLHLDGSRSGMVVFLHEKTLKLHQAPARVLRLGGLSPRERCVESARALDLYCNFAASVRAAA